MKLHFTLSRLLSQQIPSGKMKVEKKTVNKIKTEIKQLKYLTENERISNMPRAISNQYNLKVYA